MHCFFHLVNGNRTVPDDEGIDVPDVEHARREAIATIQELLFDSAQSGVDWSGWRLAIADDTRTHAVVYFDDIRPRNASDRPDQ